jgi:hypothetical protein
MMSSPLAIAAVTAVLKDLLDNALIDHSISSATGQVKVTAQAPDRVRGDTADVAQLNLFLYRVVPNQGWSNTQLPSRDVRGERRTNPPLALDLQYLLSAYERNDFEAEILLGYAMQCLHETPVLTREAIRKALAATSPVDGGALSPALGALVAADLADQVELVKIALLPLTLDELTKLWSALQSNYRPSAAYHVSVVLIDSHQPARAPLPVLTRGQPDPTTGHDQGVSVQANLSSPVPVLQAALPARQQPAVRLGTTKVPETLTLQGQRLDGISVAARFTHILTGRTFDLPVQSGGTTAEVVVQLPEDPPPAPPPPAVPDPHNPDSWVIGFYTVAVVVRHVGEPAPRITNELPLALAPRIIGSISTSSASGTITFTVKCSPKVFATQSIKLVVADREIAAEPLGSPQTSNITFKTALASLPSGAQWVRLIVDGVESMLVDRSGTVPVFDTTQQVTIP